MKKFETPTVEIIKFAVADIITTSGEIEFPFVPAEVPKVNETDLTQIG